MNRWTCVCDRCHAETPMEMAHPVPGDWVRVHLEQRDPEDQIRRRVVDLCKQCAGPVLRALLPLALLVLASCSANDHHQVDASVDAGHELGWLCYCNSVAMTCADDVPICDATDPSKRLGCACRATGPCNENADCLEVHSPEN